MIVTLVGARGSGKTAVAGPLAERLGFDAVDADEEIERVAGRTIREIFAADGEPEFRRLEREVLVDLLTRDGLVLASGGGAVLDPLTRADLRTAGPVVWLNASADELARRIAGDDTTDARRPSLTGGGVLAEIAELLEHREPLYREVATLVVETEGRTPDEIAETCLAHVRDRNTASPNDHGSPS